MRCQIYIFPNQTKNMKKTLNFLNKLSRITSGLMFMKKNINNLQCQIKFLNSQEELRLWQ